MPAWAAGAPAAPPAGVAAATPAGRPAIAAVKPQPADGWFEFTPAVVQRAQVESRLILLVLEIPANAACQDARTQVWSDPAVQSAIKSGYLPVRMRADLRPDLVARYPAEGWPAVSVLLPNGSPLWVKDAQGETRRVTSGFVPAPGMVELLRKSRELFDAGPGAAAKLAADREIEVQASARPTSGTTNDATVWGIAQQLRTTFDPERRYFGGKPRLPRFDLIEFMQNLGAETEDPWGTLGRTALDTLSAKLIDPADGGLYRLALGLDWEDPAKDKLLDRNARMLDVLALAYRQSASKADRERALKTARFIVDKLSRPEGAFAAGLCESCAGGRDETVISDANARAASALMRAGAALDDTALIDRGLLAAKFLKDNRYLPGRGVARALVEGQAPILPVHLEDLASSAFAFETAYEVTGDRDWLDAARDVAHVAVANLRDPDPKIGALRDVVPEIGGPAPLRRALYPLNENAHLTRVLVRLYRLVGDRWFLKAAASAINAFAGSYDRAPLAVPAFGLAAYEYAFDALSVRVTSRPDDPRGQALRRAALGGAFPYVMVKTLDPNRDGVEIREANLLVSQDAGAYLSHGGILSARLTDPTVLRGAMAELREKFVAQTALRQKAAAGPPPPKKPPSRGKP